MIGNFTKLAIFSFLAIGNITFDNVKESKIFNFENKSSFDVLKKGWGWSISMNKAHAYGSDRGGNWDGEIITIIGSPIGYPDDPWYGYDPCSYGCDDYGDGGGGGGGGNSDNSQDNSSQQVLSPSQAADMVLKMAAVKNQINQFLLTHGNQLSYADKQKLTRLASQIDSFVGLLGSGVSISAAMVDGHFTVAAVELVAYFTGTTVAAAATALGAAPLSVFIASMAASTAVSYYGPQLITYMNNTLGIVVQQYNHVPVKYRYCDMAGLPRFMCDNIMEP